MSKKSDKQAEFNATLEVINDIGSEIVEERLSQVERWGQQDHPSFLSETNRKSWVRASKMWHDINDARVREGSLSWEGILLEEVYEALAETDEVRRREELVQVAAVAAAEIEAIDRRLQAQKPSDPEPVDAGEVLAE